jgi:2-amino-4-hydroxy-6-hydroxymethyldihydropteridine diphosphokinase
MTHDIYLLLGTNLGNREGYLAAARAALATRAGHLDRVSALYETAAWGHTEQPAFLNQAVALSSALDAQALLEVMLEIEQSLGRERREHWGPRVIDIDLLLYHQQVIDTSTLQVPHPRMSLRRFALMPLAEIAGNAEHPVLHKKISELLAECPDQLAVRKLS